MKLKDLSNYKLSPAAIALMTVVILFSVRLAFALRTDAVDPRVTLRQEPAPYGGRSARDLATDRLAVAIDGEVTRTADRVAEATTLALLSGVYLADAGVKGGLPRDVQTLVAGLARNGLLPPGLAMTESPGTLASACGSLSIRYRPATLSVEVVSVAKPECGPALIVRLPDEDSDDGEAAKLYLADKLQGMTVPAPFAREAEVIALGWRPERLRSFM